MRTQDFDVNSFEGKVLSHLTVLLTPRTRMALLDDVDPAPMPIVAPQTRRKGVSSPPAPMLVVAPRIRRKGVSSPYLLKNGVRLMADDSLCRHSESAHHIDDSTHKIKSDDLLIEKSTELVPKAQRIVKRKSVRKYLCPALKSVSNDVCEIAKVTISVLVPLVLSQSIKIPLDPLLFATIAIVIAKMGIESLCTDYDESDSKVADKSAG